MLLKVGDNSMSGATSINLTNQEAAFTHTRWKKEYLVFCGSGNVHASSPIRRDYGVVLSLSGSIMITRVASSYVGILWKCLCSIEHQGTAVSARWAHSTSEANDRPGQLPHGRRCSLLSQYPGTKDC